MTNSPFVPPPPVALEFYPGGRHSLQDLAMMHAQHVAHTYNLAAVVVVVQAPDGDIQTAGYTMGMGDPLRGTRHLLGMLDYAKRRWGAYLLKNEVGVGNG